MQLSDGSPPPSGDKRDKDGQWRTVRFDLIWKGLPITVTFDSHIEHLLITTYLGLHALPARSGLWKTAVRVKSVLRSASPKLTVEQCDFVFGELWDMVDAILWSQCGPAKGIGKVVADSRGIVFRPHGEGAMTGHEAKLLEENWPSIYPVKDGWLPTKDAEFTISAMMGRQALHATSLGHRVRGTDTSATMRYMVAERLSNEFQVGRLLFRINRAGIARICATMHWEKLNLIGRHLRAAEALLPSGLWPDGQPEGKQKQGESKTDATSQSGKPGEVDKAGEANSLASAKGWRAKLQKIRLTIAPPTKSDEKRRLEHEEQEMLDSIVKRCAEEMANVHNVDDNGNADSIGGGVAYRSERSRQYVEEFSRVVADLRLERVDGYQRYDEYVRQRLGNAFDYIGAIGDRYQRVQTGIAQMRDRQRSYETMKIAHGIDRAQDTADVALFGVIGPYYASNGLTHMLGLGASEFAGRFIWIATFFVGSAIALHKWSHRNDTGLFAGFAEYRFAHLGWVATMLGLIAIAIFVPGGGSH